MMFFFNSTTEVRRVAVSFLVLFLFCVTVNGQDHFPNPDVTPLDTSRLAYRKMLLGRGVPSAAINSILRQNDAIGRSGRVVNSFSLNRHYNPLPTTCARCQDLGVETGWSSWQSETGVNAQVQGLLMDPVTNPSGPRFTITSGTGIDPLTPGPNPGDPPIPVVAPGFGSQSILLGQPATAGMQGGCMDTLNNIAAGCAERLICPFTVNATDTSFVYAYAFVMENPANAANPHTAENMPYIEFMILDQNGDTLPCAYQRYVADQSFSGQYEANAMVNGPGPPTYKPWTIEGVNLSGYTGQTLTIVITNADCQLSGHFAHSYWDFSCGSVSSLIRPNCNSNRPDTMIAPASEPGNPYTYLWFKNNDPNPVGTTQIITPFTQNGDTFVVKVNTASGCNWYVSYVPQHYSIAADFNATTACGNATFNDLSVSPSPLDPISYWHWDFGGGAPATSSASDPGMVAFPPGTANITLIAGTSGGCLDTFIQSIVVPPRPDAAFTMPDGCAGAMIQPINVSSVSTGDAITGYAWYMTGGTPSFSNLQQPTVSFGSSGLHDVTLVVTNLSGCTDTARTQVEIAALPDAAFSAAGVCLGEAVTPVNQTTVVPVGDPVTYSWSMPGGSPSSSTAINPSIAYAVPGLHQVTLIATASTGCADTVVQNISISAPPTADFAVPVICAGRSIVLQNTSSYPPGFPIRNYSWSIPGGTPSASSAFQPLVIFSQPDTESVTLIVSNADGCSDTASHDVIVSATPQAVFSIPPVCEGVPVTVSNSSTIQPAGSGLSYHWSVQGAVPATTTAATPAFVFTSAGTMNATLIATATGGCSDTATHPVQVNGHPTAAFDMPVFCYGAPAALSNHSVPPVGGSISSYSWLMSGSSLQIPAVANPVITVDTTGTFALSLLVTTPAGCVDSIAKPLEVHERPSVQLPDHEEACVPFCHSFSNQSSSVDGAITSWQWTFPGGDPASSNLENPGTVCYATPGNYAASVVVTSTYGCTSEMISGAAITGYSKPQASFVTDHQESTNLMPLVHFEDKSSADVVSWRWDFGDGSSQSGAPTVDHDYAAALPGNTFYHFDATLVVMTHYGCLDTATIPLDFNPSFSFYVPTAFTPNKDYRNGLFYGKGFGIKKYDIEVFDRWGLQLWSCHYEGSNIPWDMDGAEGMSAACKWDGTYQGSVVEQDVYVWKVMLTDVFDKPHAYIGRVTVVY